MKKWFLAEAQAMAQAFAQRWRDKAHGAVPSLMQTLDLKNEQHC